VPALSQVELLAEADDDQNWGEVRLKIDACREIQTQRAGKLNSELQLADLKKYCDIDKEQRAGLASIMDKLSLSARATHRIIRMARTIADIEGRAEIDERDLMEAIGYRRSPISKLLAR
jgi:magnesium chelatase family protein